MPLFPLALQSCALDPLVRTTLLIIFNARNGDIIKQTAQCQDEGLEFHSSLVALPSPCVDLQIHGPFSHSSTAVTAVTRSTTLKKIPLQH
jgi:hypothetical protein